MFISPPHIFTCYGTRVSGFEAKPAARVGWQFEAVFDYIRRVGKALAAFPLPRSVGLEPGHNHTRKVLCPVAGGALRQVQRTGS